MTTSYPTPVTPSHGTPEATRLDVRGVLAAGGEPFDLIMAAAGRVPPDGVLEITAPFEPMPLYAAMLRRGFGRSTEQRGPAEWVVTFRRTRILPEATLSALVEQYPATWAVFERHDLDLCCGGERTVEFAARAHGIALVVLLEELQAAVRADSGPE